MTFTGTLSLFTFAVIEGLSMGWTHPAIVGSFLVAIALLGTFIFVERRSARPMLDLSLLRYRRFVGVQLLPIATCYSYVVLLLLLPAE